VIRCPLSTVPGSQKQTIHTKKNVVFSDVKATGDDVMVPVFKKERRGTQRLDSSNVSMSSLTTEEICVRFVVLAAVTMKNAVFWDIKTQFVPHRRHITSPPQSPAG
jgi:hypothetical protein